MACQRRLRLARRGNRNVLGSSCIATGSGSCSPQQAPTPVETVSLMREREHHADRVDDGATCDSQPLVPGRESPVVSGVREEPLHFPAVSIAFLAPSLVRGLESLATRPTHPFDLRPPTGTSGVPLNGAASPRFRVQAAHLLTNVTSANTAACTFAAAHQEPEPRTATRERTL